MARVLALCLLVLAASPFTAPFSAVVSLDVHGGSHPTDARPIDSHPAHQMAEVHLKVAPHLVVTAPALTPVRVVSLYPPRPVDARRPLVVAVPRASRAVLRL